MFDVQRRMPDVSYICWIEGQRNHRRDCSGRTTKFKTHWEASGSKTGPLFYVHWSLSDSPTILFMHLPTVSNKLEGIPHPL